MSGYQDCSWCTCREFEGNANAASRSPHPGDDQDAQRDLHSRSRKPRHVGSPLEALNILYVLVAMGHAKIDRRHKGKQLFFNIGR